MVRRFSDDSRFGDGSQFEEQEFHSEDGFLSDSVEGAPPPVDCYGYLLGANGRMEQDRMAKLVREEPQIAQELERSKETLDQLEPLRRAERSAPVPDGLARRAFRNIVAIVRNSSIHRWYRHCWNGKMTPVTVSMSGGRADVGGGRGGLFDWIVVGVVLSLLSMWIAPAVYRARQNARSVRYQDQLREAGRFLEITTPFSSESSQNAWSVPNLIIVDTILSGGTEATGGATGRMENETNGNLLADPYTSQISQIPQIAQATGMVPVTRGTLESMLGTVNFEPSPGAPNEIGSLVRIANIASAVRLANMSRAIGMERVAQTASPWSSVVVSRMDAARGAFPERDADPFAVGPLGEFRVPAMEIPDYGISGEFIGFHQLYRDGHVRFVPIVRSR